MNRIIRFCFALLLGFAAIAGSQTKPGPAGHWEGSIKLPSGELKMILDLDRDAKGTWVGDIEMPEENVKDLPLRDISIAGESISFAIPGGQGNPVFKGKLSADGVAMSGEFSQAGNTATFALKRTGDAKVNLPDPIPTMPDKFTGIWEGKLDTPGGSVRLNFNLSNREGSAVGTIDSPDQGAMGVPISQISTAENTIKIAVKLIPAEYSAKLSDDGKTLTGEWTQAGRTFPLKLSRK